MVNHRVIAATAAIGAFCMVLASCGGGSGNPAPAAPPSQLTGTTLTALSTRADMVSGGDALMEVGLPFGATLATLKVMVGSTDVTSASTTRSDGRTVVSSTGLANGDNTYRHVDQRRVRRCFAHRHQPSAEWVRSCSACSPRRGSAPRRWSTAVDRNDAGHHLQRPVDDGHRRAVHHRHGKALCMTDARSRCRRRPAAASFELPDPSPTTPT